MARSRLPDHRPPGLHSRGTHPVLDQPRYPPALRLKPRCPRPRAPAVGPRTLEEAGIGGRRAMAGDRAAGLFAPQRRALTIGLVLSITFVAWEALAVVTVMPVVAHDLGGLRLYGWVFSGFMLGSVIGIVLAGREADRRGPAVPFVGGLVLFGSGLAVAGLAPSMGVLVAGRVLQGLGAGAVPSVAYAAIGRSFPGPLQARMMAVLSTAWVVPGLAGPAVAAEVAHVFGWRWVFLGLLPVVAVAGSIAAQALVRLGPPGAGAPADLRHRRRGRRHADPGRAHARRRFGRRDGRRGGGRRRADHCRCGRRAARAAAAGPGRHPD